MVPLALMKFAGDDWGAGRPGQARRDAERDKSTVSFLTLKLSSLILKCSRGCLWPLSARPARLQLLVLHPLVLRNVLAW